MYKEKLMLTLTSVVSEKQFLRLIRTFSCGFIFHTGSLIWWTPPTFTKMSSREIPVFLQQHIFFFCFYAYTSASLENKSEALDLATSMKHSFSSVIFLWRSCIKAHLRSCHISEGSRFLCFLFYYSGFGVSTWRSLFIKSISLECPAAITPTKALSK